MGSQMQRQLALSERVAMGKQELVPIWKQAFPSMVHLRSAVLPSTGPSF